MSLNKEEIIEEFRKYYETFDCNEEAIVRKYHHSIRVMNFAEKIAISEGLVSEDIDIAIIIGLLHDYARFEQWTNYHTYSDLKSIDHGDLAVKILFEENHIEKFYDKKENYNLIYDAIKYHNKYSIPDELSERNKMFCKIIRDADKLDIVDIIVEDILKFKDDDSEISVEVRNQFLQNNIIDRRFVKSDNDANLLKLALIYDYNYKFSYNYTIENNILDKLYNKLTNKEMFKEYFDCIRKFLAEKV